MKASLLRGLDSLALALANTGHIWTREERQSYERIVRILNSQE